MGGPRTKTERTPKGTFAPGSSGNPGGKPKGLVAKIRAKTNDGDEMIDLFLRTMRGEELSDAVINGGVTQIGPSTKDKIDAAKWLDIRLNGKPVDQIQISETEERVRRYMEMSRTELLAHIASLAKSAEEDKEQS